VRSIDNVRLLRSHLKKFSYTQECKGSYVDGVYVAGNSIEVSFEAVPLPLNGHELTLFSQGAVNFEGIKLYSKFDLGNAIDKSITRQSNSSVYRLISAKPYEEMADVKVYILRRLEG